LEVKETENEEKPAPPVDKGNFVYYSFFLYGIASLMPWSAVLNSFDYFTAVVSS
jgi:hypothetical protein